MFSELFHTPTASKTIMVMLGNLDPRLGCQIALVQSVTFLTPYQHLGGIHCNFTNLVKDSIVHMILGSSALCPRVITTI